MVAVVIQRLKFHGKNGVWVAKPYGMGYEARIQRIPGGGWGWDSTLFGGQQGQGQAPTLVEAREQVRQDYAVIAPLVVSGGAL